MIDAIFVKFVTGVVADNIKEQLLQAFRAMTEQEIYAEDINRLLSEPLELAHVHLRDACLEPIAERRLQHIENARLNFLAASHRDTPIARVRAAFYSGLCHRMLNAPASEVAEYDRSHSILCASETGLKRKLDEVGKQDLTIAEAAKSGLKVALPHIFPFVYISPAAAIAGIGVEQYRRQVRRNLKRQIAVVEAYKAAVETVIKTVRKESTPPEKPAPVGL